MEMNAAESSPRLEVDLDLLKKYNRPGPRYTSYPTAPHFHEGFGPEEYRQEILATNAGETPRDLSLYFHFPFCKSLCYFCACNVVITKDASRVGHYLGVLKKEIDLVSNLVDSRRQVVQMHWGGGTPTYMSPDQIRAIFGYIREKFPFAAEAEISIEIDPRTISPEHLPALREAGFNRVSFGLQDVNSEVQTTINRIQTDEQNAFVINESRRLGFDSINVDLIYVTPTSAWTTLRSPATNSPKPSASARSTGISKATAPAPRPTCSPWASLRSANSPGPTRKTSKASPPTKPR